jgi:hypothetical protein
VADTNNRVQKFAPWQSAGKISRFCLFYLVAVKTKEPVILPGYF